MTSIATMGAQLGIAGRLEREDGGYRTCGWLVEMASDPPDDAGQTELGRPLPCPGFPPRLDLPRAGEPPAGPRRTTFKPALKTPPSVVRREGKTRGARAKHEMIIAHLPSARAIPWRSRWGVPGQCGGGIRPASL